MRGEMGGSENGRKGEHEKGTKGERKIGRIRERKEGRKGDGEERETREKVRNCGSAEGRKETGRQGEREQG